MQSYKDNVSICLYFSEFSDYLDITVELHHPKSSYLRNPCTLCIFIEGKKGGPSLSETHCFATYCALTVMFPVVGESMYLICHLRLFIPYL